MSPRVPLTVALALALLSACSAPAAMQARTKPATAATAAASAKPAPRASVGLKALKAGTGTKAIAGTVTLDVSYLLSQHVGAVQEVGGAQVVAVGDGLISQDGGSLISQDGGTLISQDGGTLISQDGGTALASDGTSFLAAGSLISQDGGTLISQDGGTIVAQGGGNYRLAADAALPAGTQLPAAGMLVSAVSPRTGRYLPVGVDDAGQPAYTVYSNGKGAYQLYLPAEEAGNVIIVANVPNTRDPRLAFNTFLAEALPADVTVDDDTALATLLLREGLIQHLIDLITSPDKNASLKALNAEHPLPDAANTLLLKMVDTFYDLARQYNVPTGADAGDIPEVRALATRMADVAASYVPYDSLYLASEFSPDAWPGPHEHVITAYADTLKHLREDTAAYLTRNPSATELTFPHMVYTPGSAGSSCTYQERIKLQHATDPSRYLEEILGATTAGIGTNVSHFFDALAVTSDEPALYQDPATGQTLRYSLRVEVAGYTVLGVAALTLFPPGQDDASPALKAVEEAIAAYAKSHPFTSAPVPRPHLGLATPCVPSP